MATHVPPRQTVAPPARRIAGARREALLIAALFLSAVLISGFTMLRGIDQFDEGLMLQAARRVGEGQLPYRDFLWSYGPGQPYLLAALHQVTGVSLLDWRVLRVLADAGVAVFAFLLARRSAGERPALAAWLTAACAMAQPRSANPFPFALLFVLAALWLGSGEPGRRRVVSAGLLIALAAAWRFDFAVFGGAAVLVMLLLGRRRGDAGVFALTAAAGTVVAYAPFLIAIGPADLYQSLIGTSLHDGPNWTLPFPLSYDGRLRLWPPGAAAHDLKDVLDFYVPLLELIALALGAAAVAVRWRRERRPPALWAGLVVLGGGFVLYLRSRTDEFHTTPLIVVAAILLVAAAAWALGERGRPRALGWACAAAAALLLLQGAGNRLSALHDPDREAPIGIAVSDGVEAPVGEAAALRRTVALVQQRVPPGEPIYVATRRSDLVRFSAPLLYVLTERDNPTPQDFGLLTGATAQARLVAELERARPRVVVRWTDPSSSEREPNLRGRSSGVHTLDEWIARNYRLLQRAGYYDVLVPR
ncbi:MAG: hypothetical protein QOE08_1848 [Thermoleophilaceae bacterium]|nr:hypothetical protein [Thermoleophilaceae bacterium]